MVSARRLRADDVRVEPLADGLDIAQPPQAGDLARDDRAGAGDAGHHRGGGQRAERGRALERRGDPPIGIDDEPAGDGDAERGQPERDARGSSSASAPAPPAAAAASPPPGRCAPTSAPAACARGGAARPSPSNDVRLERLCGHRSRSPTRNSSARSRLMCGDAVDRRRIDHRRLEQRHVEERRVPGVRPRRPDRHRADEELRLLVAADRPADHDLHALAVDLLGILDGRDHRRDRHHVEARARALGLDRREAPPCCAAVPRDDRATRRARDRPWWRRTAPCRCAGPRSASRTGCRSRSGSFAGSTRSRGADPRTPRGRRAARAARRPARSGARTSGSDPRRSARPPRACRCRNAAPSARRACSAPMCAVSGTSSGANQRNGASASVPGHRNRPGCRWLKP